MFYTLLHPFDEGAIGVVAIQGGKTVIGAKAKETRQARGEQSGAGCGEFTKPAFRSPFVARA
ncbi:MAG: hypothetical protein RI841_09735 [Halomonas sp.]|nr:hypothetical protein [Halomonas sp.]